MKNSQSKFSEIFSFKQLPFLLNFVIISIKGEFGRRVHLRRNARGLLMKGLTTMKQSAFAGRFLRAKLLTSVYGALYKQAI